MIFPKSTADYMGIPAGTAPQDFSALDFRAFGLTWNNWFRDQNLQSGIDVPLDDIDRTYVTDIDAGIGGFYGDDYITETCRGGALPPVNKFHDYFTSALKEPQKGDPVPIPLNGFAPIVFNNQVEIPYDYSNMLPFNNGNWGKPSLFNFEADGPVDRPASLGVYEGDMVYLPDENYDAGTRTSISNGYAALGGVGKDSRLSDDPYASAYATINDLRFSFAIQRLLENDNRAVLVIVKFFVPTLVFFLLMLLSRFRNIFVVLVLVLVCSRLFKPLHLTVFLPRVILLLILLLLRIRIVLQSRLLNMV